MADTPGYDTTPPALTFLEDAVADQHSGYASAPTVTMFAVMDKIATFEGPIYSTLSSGGGTEPANFEGARINPILIRGTP